MKFISDHIESIIPGICLASVLSFGAICFKLGKLDS